MKKIIIILSLLVLLTSCDLDTPSDYQKLPARDIIIWGKEYKVKNVSLCEDSSSCNVWIVYPKNWTWEVILSNPYSSWKSKYQNSTIIVE